MSEVSASETGTLGALASDIFSDVTRLILFASFHHRWLRTRCAACTFDCLRDLRLFTGGLVTLSDADKLMTINCER
jgi:hypothetical protein